MKTQNTRGASLRAAFILNAVFLVLAVLIVRVGFESNDDPTLAAFVDGQIARSTAVTAMPRSAPRRSQSAKESAVKPAYKRAYWQKVCQAVSRPKTL